MTATAVRVPTAPSRPDPAARLSLFAMAIGGFGIGTTEFASMGLLPRIADGFGVGEPQAGSAITTYAMGVVVGAPLFAVLSARRPRKGLLLLLVGALAAANLLSALAPDLNLLLGARFLAGLPHGAYFGLASVVAASLVPAGHRAKAVATVMTGLMIANVIGVPLSTWLGQQFGWRTTYLAVAVIQAVAAAAIAGLVPRQATPVDVDVRRELSVLRDARLWLTLATGAIGFGGLFAVYSYISSLLTEVTGLGAGAVPGVLVTVGLGMTLGNLVGGRLADWSTDRTIGLGFIATAASLLLLAASATVPACAVACLFLLGFSGVSMGPAVTSRLMNLSEHGQSLAASLNQSAFNIANALGAALGGAVIGAGYGFVAPAYVGAGLALLGMTALGLTVGYERRHHRPAGHLTFEEAFERMYAVDRAEYRTAVRRVRARQAAHAGLHRFSHAALSLTPTPM